MSFPEFLSSLSNSEAPAGIGAPLQALWLDAKEDWAGAHRLVQDDSSSEAAWVHAYLHRKEGDVGNADYWYARAGRTRPELSLEKEWEAMSAELLARPA